MVSLQYFYEKVLPKAYFPLLSLGICHGVSTFVVDYTTPFGLLALETICRIREMGEHFVFLGL